MSHSTGRSFRRASCAALALLILAGTTATPAPATTIVHFQPESYAALLVQVHKGEVHAVVLHPSGPKAHVALNDGAHFTATYPLGEATKLGAEVRAHGGAFSIATAKHKTGTVHHKLRYIAGGILIVVIVVVLAVLLIGRRRAIAEDEEPRHGGDAASTR
ncbi:MAG TPA: hypothetical protein VMS02_00300 [Solirubrobacteraceae bacterium]|nr:hypothetical protein [Solirubrobacteraceae bacterium]